MRLCEFVSACLFCSIVAFGQQSGNSANSRVSEAARQNVYPRLSQATPPWATAGDCATNNPDFYRCQAWVMTRDNRNFNPALRSAPPPTPPRSFSAISINVENVSVSGRTAEVRLGVQAKCEFLTPPRVFGSALQCTPAQTLATKVVVKLQAQGLLGNDWIVTGISEDPHIIGQRQAQQQAGENVAARQQQEGQRFVQLAEAVCRANDAGAARRVLQLGVGDVNASLVVLRALMPDPCPFAYERFIQVAVGNHNVEMVAVLAEHGANLETLVSEGPNSYTPLASLCAYAWQDATIDTGRRRMILTLLQNGANPAPALQRISEYQAGCSTDSCVRNCQAFQRLLRTPVVVRKGSVAP
jgi:hypothetical protein